MPRLNQRGVVHFLLPLILLLGIIAGVWLITSGNPLKLFSRATNPPIVFKALDGSSLPVNSNGIPQLTVEGNAAPTVKVELTSPLGPAQGSTRTQSFSLPKIVETAHAQGVNTIVKIRAWGRPAAGVNPKIRLEDGDAPLATFEVKATSKNNAEIFTYTFPQGRAFRSRPLVRFLNDYYNPPEDRNVSIDYLEVYREGRERFESEDPTTYSAGSWDTGNGCGYGYKKQERLHCEGFFRYDKYALNRGVSAPITTPITVYTTHYKIAENPTDLDQAEYQSYAADPTVVNFTFRDATSGPHFIWIEFKDSTGKTDRRSAQIEFVAPSISSPIAPPTPTPTPQSISKRVFITSTTYNGNLGGLSGADAKCQERANAVSLGGTWKAWLSDSTTTVASRLTHSTILYKLLNGNTVANNWTDLTDGSLQTGINYTEYNQYSDPNNIFAWTNTYQNGAHIPWANDSCRDWTNSEYGIDGITGSVGSTIANWTNNARSRCSSAFPLYCFEQ